jgi:D-alanine-D-alanine ligase
MNMNWSDIVILFGGSSDERLVSVASAQNLARQIPEAQLLYTDLSGSLHYVSRTELQAHANPFTEQFTASTPAFAGHISKALEHLKNKTIIIAMHGTEGEDGTLQKILEQARIPFTGTGSQASSDCFDKKVTKLKAHAAHLPVIDDFVFRSDTLFEAQLKNFYFTHKKIVIKPVASGSSVGLYIVNTTQDLEAAITGIKILSIAFIAEPFITGREITVCTRENLSHQLSCLPCSEVRVIQGRQFDYQGKYLGQGVEELTPAPISSEESRACQNVALQLHKLMGCFGYSRTDMILTERGPILLEINTLPGLSKASFVPQQLEANQENLRDFFAQQVTLARQRVK